MQKARWLIGVFGVLVAAIGYSNICCANGDPCSERSVLPAMKVCKEIPGKKTKICRCEKRVGFKRNEYVHVFGSGFPPLTSVDVYVKNNKVWNAGDPIGNDNGDGVDVVQTDSNGNIPCTHIWGAPLTSGHFDIVVDVNQDGTFNDCDKAYKKQKARGFEVR